MQPARGLGIAFCVHTFRDGGSEGNDIMPYFAFDFLNAIQIERCALSEGFGSGRRDVSHFGKDFRSCEFGFEPAFVFVLLAPDGTHFRARVAGDHRW